VPGLSAGENADASLNYATIERELRAHDERLARLPRVLALSKADLITGERARGAVAEWKRRLGPRIPVIATSSASGLGVAELARELLRSVPPERPPSGPASDVHDAHATGRDSAEAGHGSGAPDDASGARAPAPADRVAGERELVEHMVFRPATTGFRVERRGPRSFAVRGRGIERLLERYDIDNEEAMAYVEGRLRSIGVLKALQAEGFQPGDEIEIAGVTFSLDPSAAI
jgi:GTP-binding protein